MFRFFELIRTKNSFINNISVLVTGTALGQTIYLISLPFLSRIFSPDDFGIATTLISIAAIAASIATFKFDTAIVGRSKNESERLLAISIICSLLFTLVFLFLLHISFHLISKTIVEIKEKHLFLIAAATLGMSFEVAFRFFHIWSAQYRAISRASIWRNSGRVAGAVLFGLLSFGWVALVIGEVLGYWLAAASLILLAWRQGRLRFVPQVTSRTLLSTAKKHRNYALWLVPSTLIDTFAFNSLVPTIIFLYGAEEAGFFALAYRALMAPLGLITLALADVFHHRIADLSLHEPAKAKEFLFKCAGYIAAVGALPTILLAWQGEFLFTAVFGDAWATSGKMLQVMVPWALMQITVSPLSRAILVYNRPKIKLLFDISALFALVISLYGGRYIGLDLITSILLLSVLNVFAYILYFTILVRVVGNDRREAG